MSDGGLDFGDYLAGVICWVITMSILEVGFDKIMVILERIATALEAMAGLP